MIKIPLPSFFTPNRRVLAATLLSGLVILFFFVASSGFISAWLDMREVVQDNQLSRLASDVNSQFQLAISKAKNFAMLKDDLNRGRALDYFKRSKERFSELSRLEDDPQAKTFLYKLDSALKGVEFSLDILLSKAEKTDPPETLYRHYLKDITIDFDNAARAYLDFQEEKIARSQKDLYSNLRKDVIAVLLGVLLSLGVIALSLSVTEELRLSLDREEKLRFFDDLTEETILVHDQGVIVEVNRALAALLGYTQAEMIGKNLYHFMDKSSTDVTRDRIEKGYPEGSYEIMAKARDGALIPLLVHGRDFTYRGRFVRASSGWNMTEWKKAEEVLRENQERFERFAEVTKEGIMFHENGVIIDVNPRLLEMTGCEAKEFIGSDGLQFLTKESAERVRGFRTKGYPDEPYEITFQRKDGTVVPMEVHGMNFSFGGLNLRVASFWDLTERKKAEEALKQSEGNFRTIIESAPDAMMVNQDGKVFYANRRFRSLLGYGEQEDLSAMEAISIVLPENRPPVARRIQNTPQGTVNPPLEIRVMKKDGAVIPVEATSVGLQYEGRPSILVILRDITERKKAEAAIAQKERHFRALIENSHDIISTTDKDAVVTYISPSVKRILGHEPSDLVGQRYAPIMHPDDIGRMREIFAKFLDTREVTVTAEFRLRHKNGSWREIESTGINLLDNPEVQGIVYNMRDITDRRQAEELLRESEENFRNLIENSNDVISLVGVDGRSRYVSPSIRKVMGYNPEERVGHSFTELVHPEDLEKVKQLFLQFAYKPGVTVEIEVRARHKNGSWRQLEAVATNLIDHPAIRGIIINYRDVTDKKMAEESAKKSEERFRRVFEDSPIGIGIVHLDARIISVNAKFAEILGYSPAELVGRPFNEITHPDDVNLDMENFGRLFRGEVNSYQIEKRYLHKNGSIVWGDLTATLVRDPAGKPLYGVGMVEDITQRKKTQEALMRFERLSTIGEMAASLAHEIRNPLAAIYTAAQLMKRQKARDEKEDPYVDTIMTQSQRLERLVEDTMDYARADKPASLEVFSSREALESALHLCQIQFGPSHTKVRVEWDLPPQDLKLKGNPQRIQQILINLILNAYQIMTEGGMLRIGLKTERNSAFIRVEDEGPGMTDENMKRLFEPFFTTKSGGSGLGLALSQRIAREHDGAILVEKRKPKGMTFILRLPLDREGTT